ncbi:MAG TPA: nucleotide sugar dehydrogenase [Methanomicrobiales archaeon]|nr:nucleotide sugar dehydrogenase [Methanomicrobiales archaeon]
MVSRKQGQGLAEILRAKGPIERVGVVGMGYVGIPSSVLFAGSGAFEEVVGFQRDSPSSGYKIAMLNRGESPLKGEEPELGEMLRKVVEEGTYRCSSDFSLISGMDAVTLAIQTPFRNPADLIPDFTPLHEGLASVGKHMSKGTLVVIESTVTPGTTGGTARGILEEESGLVAGRDFALAHAPERVMVGRLLQNIREHDRVVGGIDAASTERARELYGTVLTTGRIIPMTAVAAEVTKTAENAFRDLQIAAANQLALYCEAMGVNFYDVHKGIASLKGEGITRAILYPGAGVGGHCLPKDTYHLERGVKEVGKGLDYPADLGSLFLLARGINDFMPRHMHRLTVEGLRRTGKELSGARVALLGWAFLQNSDDTRNTPSEPYRDLLVDGGAEVSVHDQYVDRAPGVTISHDLREVITGADAIAIMTAHKAYRSLAPADLRSWSGEVHPVIVDGRNLVDPDAYIAEGFVYQGIGRGDRNRHPIS